MIQQSNEFILNLTLPRTEVFNNIACVTKTILFPYKILSYGHSPIHLKWINFLPFTVMFLKISFDRMPFVFICENKDI